MTYTIHPAAALFPMMDDDKLKTLVEDIRENGLIDPIEFNHNGSILIDGRNRIRACEIAGVPYTTKNLPEMTDEAILKRIVSANIHRRHLSKDQLTVLAAELEPMYAAAAKERQRLSGEQFGRGHERKVQENSPEPIKPAPQARDQAAAAVGGGVTGRSVSDAKALNEEAPDLAEEVRNGVKSLSKATKERKERKAGKTKEERAERDAQIADLKDQGKTNQEISDVVGINKRNVDNTVRAQKAAREAEETTREVTLAESIDYDSAPLSAQAKVDGMVRRRVRELEKEHNTRLLAELDQHRAKLDAEFAAHKAAHDEQNQKLNAMRDDERRRYKLGIEVQSAKGLITPKEYTTILACLHPDNSASTEKRSEAFRLFNDLKIKTLLVKEV